MIALDPVPAVPDRPAGPCFTGVVTAHDVAKALPSIPMLRDRSRAMALLDAILSPDPEFRYYSFDAHWAPDEQLASMRNGSGDAYSIVFSPDGAFIRGLDHESPMAPAASDAGMPWPGVCDAVPAAFERYVTEPAICYDGSLDASVCIWRAYGQDRWQVGNTAYPEVPDPDGAGRLFELLVNGTTGNGRRATTGARLTSALSGIPSSTTS